MRRRTRGVALVTVLLIVAIASLAATALLGTSSLAIHRTAVLRDTEQAWWLAWSGQSLALAGLAEDRKRAGAIDDLTELWAQPVEYPVDQGGIRGRIVDQQGLFNLNTLASGDPVVQKQARDQFGWLLANLGIQDGPDLLAAILDWMDADDVPLPGGAEDSAYAGLTVPYRAANRPFTTASELMAVKGMTPESYRLLRPNVTALPNDKTSINVNTAPVPVLLALCQYPDLNNTKAFDAARRDAKGRGPAQDRNDFVARNTCGGTFHAARLDVTSSYFRVEGEAFIGSSRVALYSLIDRTTLPPKVLSFSTDGD